ncbi:hypothetical protein [Roseicyclus marinus]|nr:hypothetical protein [Roseicyclus marinus]MDG3041597.1 hypothetical protein [Roseicyclus marinus]
MFDVIGLGTRISLHPAAVAAHAATLATPGDRLAGDIIDAEAAEIVRR